MNEKPIRLNLTRKLIKMALLFAFFTALLYYPHPTFGGEKEKELMPTRYGFGAVLGDTYRAATDLQFVMLTGFALFDYERIWPHSAPDSLFFKVEGSLGATIDPWTRTMASVNIMAHYRPALLSTDHFKPYVEGGIGIIYTNFQLEDQGLKFNFNPQIGFGADIEYGRGPPFFMTLRLHHVSNAGLHEDNRGINSITLTFGRYF